jgi:Skp family chaperone for outer membrane proteins
MQKGFLAFLVLLFVCISIPAFAQSGIKIAVVDTEKAFQESVWGKKALEEMEKEASVWQKKGEQIDNVLTKLESDLTKRQQFIDNKDEEQKLQDQIDSKRLEGQTLIQEGQASLKQKQQELMDPIIQEIKDLIKKIAMEDGYDLVLEKQLDIYKIVLYVNPELDITSKVTVMLDKSYKDKNQIKAKESEKEAGKPADKPKESGKEDSK